VFRRKRHEPAELRDVRASISTAERHALAARKAASVDAAELERDAKDCDDRRERDAKEQKKLDDALGLALGLCQITELTQTASGFAGKRAFIEVTDPRRTVLVR